MGIKTMGNTNPLAKHFRQPAVYIKLPSQGKFWPDGTINIPPTGELPVYPMTVKDEIALKTPDALMNGAGVADTIKSCIPDIIDPYACPTVDLDAILIAIRLASYGQTLDITSTCPNCKTENENAVELVNLLDRIRVSEYQDQNFDNLQFKFKPQTFAAMNTANLVAFEEQKLLAVFGAEGLDETQKNEQFKASFKRLTNLSVLTLVNSIDSITTEDGVVVRNPEDIKEYLENCERQTYDALKTQIDQYSSENKLQPLRIKCDNCETQYTSDITFDQSNFFG
jgi:hypothetical protein